MQRHEQAVHVKDGQRVQEHVAAMKTPGRHERQRIAAEIAVREHRALGAARGPGGIQDAREIVRRARHRHKAFRTALCPVHQFAAVGVEREHHGLHGHVLGQRRHDAQGLVAAEDDPRLGIVEKILELAALVRRVERQVDQSRPQAGEIQRHDLPVLVGLHRDAITRFTTGSDQRVSDPRRRAVKLVVSDRVSAGNEYARLRSLLRKVAFDQRVEIRIHPVCMIV